MKREPVWPIKSVLLALHEEQIAEHGGRPGLRDEGLLDSALARPRQAFAYGAPTLLEMAALLAVGLCKNHPFDDGNKRASLIATELFLELNGLTLAASDAELVTTWVAVAEGAISEAALAVWIEEKCRGRPD